MDEDTGNVIDQTMGLGLSAGNLCTSRKPPDIRLIDDQGNLQSHSQFLPYQYPPPITQQHMHAALHDEPALQHRSRTFTTLHDALEHNARLYSTQETNNVMMPTNGLLAGRSLRKSYEEILVNKMDNRDPGELVNRLIQLLDDRHIAYELSRSGSIHLNHSQGQVKMEVVRCIGNDFNDLRFRHMSGDTNHNRRLCHDLLEYLCN